ncbi:tetratricopeptide repeat protein [Fulvivirga sp. 29W222]|uniref:Tetratricopeptide repeat protein n=1 Tax=Fulvivirga marina TaxID=2494733 RepID=A0A937KCU4_9BACT|nr:tetratricopeptide repeat protein [Fulvivirga marina]MBL6445355.1 tetratricopeptide repeat protein [Fulvivirga marina]
MPKTLLLLIVLIVGNTAFASNNFDSLYNFANKQASVELAESSLLATTENSEKAKTYYLIGYLYQSKSMYHNSLINYFSALKLYRDLDNQTQCANLLENIGVIFRKAGYHDTAIKYYSQAMDIKLENNDTLGVAWLNYNIGRVYRMNKDKEAAINAFNRSLNIFEQLNDNRSKAATLNEIGLAFQMDGFHSKAIEYFEMAMSIVDGEDRTKREIKSFNNIGYSYLIQGDYGNALNYLKRPIEEKYRIYISNRDMALVHQNVGTIYDSLGEVTSAIEHYNMAFEYSNPNDLNPEYVELCERLKNAYKGRDNAKAFEFSDEVYKAASKLYAIKEKLDELNIQYQTEAANYKLQRDEKQAAMESQKINNLIVQGIVSILAMGIIIALYAIAKKKFGGLHDEINNNGLDIDP